MNKALNVATLVIGIVFSSQAASANETSLSALIGGCSLSLSDGWELASRDALETTFRIRGNGLSSLIYADFDPEIYSSEAERIINKSQIGNITLLRVGLAPPKNIENLEVSEYAYIHDSKYSLTVMGPLAETFWARDFLENRISGECG